MSKENEWAGEGPRAWSALYPQLEHPLLTTSFRAEVIDPEERVAPHVACFLFFKYANLSLPSLFLP